MTPGLPIVDKPALDCQTDLAGLARSEPAQSWSTAPGATSFSGAVIIADAAQSIIGKSLSRLAFASP
ncbi:hypothetical protein KX928_08745 [Roseobacter sp. YSTF-M11]|uniref:Uncharacterized protein n=1 Tax=Roseobacter insulae TaxID=2859783 RepID=A0A9X1FUC2_9RHOB|nr:hypothetical protein [Roseobacter insulae]MBW4707871.1 hypothetical protein [Roseobacter insulae]